MTFSDGRGRRSLATPVGAVLTLLVAFCVSGRDLRAQQSLGSPAEVTGRVVEESTGEAIDGALVILLDDSGTPVARTLTTGSGGFELVGVPPGTYRLRIERIGYRSWTSPTLRVGRGDPVRRTVRMPVEPVELPPVRVSACVSSPAEVPGLDALWGEIRTALRIEVWAEEEGLYRFSTRERRRLLRGDSLAELEVQTRRRHGVTGVPYASAPPEDLAANGYVQRRGSRLVFFGPDARTFLSDAFHRSHCFHAEPPAEEHPPDWIGLAFEPAPGRSLPDVRGVLWVDGATSELERMVFEFTNLPAGIEDPRIGGRVDFERLGNGAWIVHRWRLRIPDISGREGYGMRWIHRASGWRVGQAPPPGVSLELKQLDGETGEVTTSAEASEVYDVVEESGEVLAAGAGPARLGSDEAATIAGRIVPSEGEDDASFAGCRVRVVGTDYFGVVAGDGSFHLGYLPPGTLWLVATENERAVGERAASVSAPGAATELWARPGRSYHLDLTASGCVP